MSLASLFLSTHTVTTWKVIGHTRFTSTQIYLRISLKRSIENLDRTGFSYRTSTPSLSLTPKVHESIKKATNIRSGKNF